jgi:hypothetical protein
MAWVGKPIHVPPSQPPAGVQLPGCSFHQWVFPSEKCEHCANYRKLPLPQPPCVFYPAIRMARRSGSPAGELNVFLQTTNEFRPTHNASRQQPLRSKAPRTAVHQIPVPKVISG